MGFKNLMLVLFFSCAACFCSDNPDDGIACTQQFVYGLNITCKDASTNAVITEGLTVVAVDGSYEETLINDPGSSVFIGAGERAGNYIITVTSNAYETYTSQEIILEADECHVIPQSIEIVLQPN